MSLIDYMVQETILVDFGSEILYGQDQVYVDHPEVFATIGFQLMSTEALVNVADSIRVKKGFKPTCPEGYRGFEFDYDRSGWYDFMIGINDYSETKVDSVLEFVLVNSDQADNEETYAIDLDEHEQRAIYKAIDEQCLKYLDKNLEDLLAEARKAMHG